MDEPEASLGKTLNHQMCPKQRIGFSSVSVQKCKFSSVMTVLDNVII